METSRWCSRPDAYARHIDGTLRWQKLQAAVKALKPTQKAVIELAYYEGRSQAEMANRLQLPLGTVKTRARSALKHLRSELVEPTVLQNGGAGSKVRLKWPNWTFRMAGVKYEQVEARNAGLFTQGTDEGETYSAILQRAGLEIGGSRSFLRNAARDDEILDGLLRRAILRGPGPPRDGGSAALPLARVIRLRHGREPKDGREPAARRNHHGNRNGANRGDSVRRAPGPNHEPIPERNITFP